jgi:hypothetical protein
MLRIPREELLTTQLPLLNRTAFIILSPQLVSHKEHCLQFSNSSFTLSSLTRRSDELTYPPWHLETQIP